MNKYASLEGDIYSIFSSLAWKSENIITIPDNYAVTAAEYIRVSIVTGGYSIVNIPRSCSGQLIIDIFTPAGAGLKRTTEIADRLDTYLAGKSIETSVSGSTQFGTSTFSPRGNDTANPSLYRSIYSVSFNYYGK